ncbi:MAG TPA: helicase-associated domain-containing protein, partial [Anaerolineales bacterium]|nr:helicase-associated domain-containing protein [Anaerolineales bacterium]
SVHPPMPDLYDSLLKQDMGHLRVIAELWGLELKSTEADAAREELAVSLLDPDLVAELVDSLSPEANSAINALINTGGRIPWPTFTRKYGEIREAGAGKRDREKLYLNPTSTTEILYYRALLARAFFDTQKGPQEFAYIPDDLLSLLSSDEEEEPEEKAEEVEPIGRAASPGEKGQDIPATDFILDDATTLLAALRLGIEPPETRIPTKTLQSLLQSANLLKGSTPQPEPVKSFLESSRSDALAMLQDAWVESDSFNELWLVPTLICEGEWKNQPQETREFLLNLLNAIPEGKWWSINAFIRDIKQKYADFQRPAGDYDSWFIKRASDGGYLRGFASWDQVDGALIRYFITNILHWLGQVDLCIADGATEPTSFRVLNAEAHIAAKEDKKLHISSQGLISIPRLAPRVVRYQVSRFCEWEEPKDDVYRYRLSTRSLAKAKEQGLKVEHLLALLSRHSDAGMPPSLSKALKRWETNGTEARVQTQVILKVSKPDVLEELRRSKASKFLGEVLSPTTVVIKGGAVQKVMEALAELGLLMEVVGS